MKRLFWILTASLMAVTVTVSADKLKVSRVARFSPGSMADSSGTAQSSGTSAAPSTGTTGGKTGGADGGSAAAAGATLKVQDMPFSVYSDQGARTNHYIPSGWMGDYGDLKLNPGEITNPHSGKTCIKITYSGKMTNNAGWAGIFWQHPANNWGDKKGGFNLTKAKRLSFWARGNKGGEKIAEFKCGGITGEYPDTDSASIGPAELTQEWKQYIIDLKDKDLSGIIGGFAWAASRDDNFDGFIIYLDDITYE